MEVTISIIPAIGPHYRSIITGGLRPQVAQGYPNPSVYPPINPSAATSNMQLNLTVSLHERTLEILWRNPSTHCAMGMTSSPPWVMRGHLDSSSISSISVSFSAVGQDACLCIYCSVCGTFWWIYLSVCLAISLSVFLSCYFSTNLSAYMTTYLSAYMTVCL